MMMNENVALLLFRYVGRQVLGGQHLVMPIGGDVTRSAAPTLLSVTNQSYRILVVEASLSPQCLC